MGLLTKEALNVGIVMMLENACCRVVTVIAPGGKLVTICDAHIRTARAHSVGVARRAAGTNSMKKFDLIENNVSIVETFIVDSLKRRQRYWQNAIARADRKAKPKALARMFDAVEM